MNDKAHLPAHPYLLLSVTALFWAGNAIAGKLAVGHVSPFLLTLMRWALVSLILIPFALPHLKRDWPVIRKNIIFLLVLGAVGFSCFNNLMYLALNYTSAINVAIEQASMPLLVFFLNYLLFRTRVTIFQIAGFVITLVGVCVTVMRGDLFGFDVESLNIGDLIMLLAIMVYGTYSVFLRNKPDIHVLSFLAVLSIAALLASIPFALYEMQNGSLIAPDAQGYGVIVYAALFPSLISQILWVMGLDQVGSNRGGLFINLVPIFGALLAILILGEKFMQYHAIGLVLVLGGIWTAQKVAVVQN